MDGFVKRKNENTPEKDKNKRPKKESCPHNERCYRRNPHHFKEYEHAYLNEIIKGKDPPVIPDSWPQPKNIYFEQIEIMKSFLAESKPKMQNPSNQEAQTSKTPIKQTAGQTLDNSKPGPSRTITNVSSTSTTPISASNNGKGTMMEKLERASPYNIFFTTIIKAPQTTKQPNAITFTDLLCPSLGVLKNSLQINFMIDIDWLLKQYKARGLSSKPLTILFGDDWPDMAKFIDMFCPNVKYKLIKMKDPFGVHHSKIGIYVYEDNSLRVVVSTANLYYEDWNHYNQGLWLSPICPRLPDSSPDSAGESPTGFKKDLLDYLKKYNEPLLQPFISLVRRADFSSVRVFLLYSVPGKHFPNSNGCHQHAMADLLSAHCSLPQKTSAEAEGPLSWGVMAQASSIGSMGKTPDEWLKGSILLSLACHNKIPRPRRSKVAKPSASKATLSIVYPSVDNVMRGYFGAESGGCLPYSKTVNEKQRWLQEYMHQWKAESFGRSRAMPHIKTYCRVSPCLNKLAYFLITSANLSKSAWGGPVDANNGSYVRSYEVGVLFLPKFFDEDDFQIKNTLNGTGRNLFPFMYDLPLTSYKDDDYPWCN